MKIAQNLSNYHQKIIAEDIDSILKAINQSMSTYIPNSEISLINKDEVLFKSFIVSDDFWTNDKLERQIFFMKKFKHTFTYTNYTTFIVKSNNKIFKKKILVPDEFNYEKFIKDSSLPMSSMIIERSIIGTTKFRKVKNVKKCQEIV